MKRQHSIAFRETSTLDQPDIPDIPDIPYRIPLGQSGTAGAAWTSYGCTVLDLGLVSDCIALSASAVQNSMNDES